MKIDNPNLTGAAAGDFSSKPKPSAKVDYAVDKAVGLIKDEKRKENIEQILVPVKTAVRTVLQALRSEHQQS